MFFVSTWELGHFLFSTFKFWITVSPEKFKLSLADLFGSTTKDHQTDIPSFIEIHRTKGLR